MSAPSVLLVELDRRRRQALGLGLTAEGYEVVPAVDVEEALRFAEALGPAVIVAPLELALGEGGRVLDDFAIHDGSRTLVLLGEGAAQAAEVRDEALLLPVAGLDDPALVRAIRLALVGREIGVEPDHRLQGLVGDFSLIYPIDLVRRLHRIGATGRIETDGGTITLHAGDVIAAAAGRARGLKAFCRLARRADGAFRVLFDSDERGEREIEGDLEAAITAAIGDSVAQYPDPETCFRVRMGDGFFAQPYTPTQQELLSVAHRGGRLSELLDASPLPDAEVLSALEELERRGVLERVEARPAVAIITDSTADLPAQVMRDHGIQVVPLTVHFGSDSYVDRAQLEPSGFYELLQSRSEHPRTSPPTADRFALEFHRRLQTQDVVAIHISERLSQTVTHAREAARERDILAHLDRPPGRPPQLEVLDSGQVSLPLGLLALFGARMARRGLAAGDIARRLDRIGQRIVTLFVVDTLEYLARGGRIGKARAWVGGLIGIRPILAVERGEVVGIDRVRGRRAAQPRLLELAESKLEAGRPTIAGVAHARAPVWADRLRELVAARFAPLELYVTEMGSVVGTHTGPGCVGATFFQPTEEELPWLRPLDAEERGSPAQA